MKSIFPLLIGLAALISAFVLWKLTEKKKGTSSSTSMPQSLYFKSNRDALEYSCKFLNNTHSIQSIVPALIDQIWDKEGDDMVELGIFLASNDTPQPATCFVPKALRLQVGDLIGCSVIPRESRPFIMAQCKLKPEYSVKNGGWVVETAFHVHA